jgi:hypothetical protein
MNNFTTLALIASALAPFIALGAVENQKVPAAGVDSTARADAVRVVRTLGDCNVVWDSPSKDSFGSMPLGNGDIGLNVWVEENGELLFYISKVDAFDAVHLLPKLGKVRVRLSPNPFTAGKAFRQELVLRDGMIEIEGGGQKTEAGGRVKLRIWVDANKPVIRVVGESAVPLDVAVSVEWLRGVMNVASAAECDGKLPKGGTAGILLDDKGDRLAWGYRNISSNWKAKLVAQKQAALAKKIDDPLLHLTSGCLVKGAGFVREKTNSLRLKDKGVKIDVTVHVLSCQTDTAAAWFSRIEEQSGAVAKADQEKTVVAHRDWWHAFWDRSCINVEKCGEGPVRLDGYLFTQFKETVDEYCKGQMIDSRINAFQITQRYALERFAQACANRGRVPSPFNGSIFTMDLPAVTHQFVPKGTRANAVSADSRDWGSLPFFWQNTRHPYWSMLARGDFDTMLPAFRLIRESLEVSRDRCRQWFGHDGAFMTEGIMMKGAGVQNSLPGHLKYHYLGTIEMTAMMCDYYEHTQDRKFAEETLLPCADEFIKFYELHFPQRDERGKMIMEPAGVVETYQPVTNPVTEVCGLRYLLAKLISFDEAIIGKERREHWAKLLQELPDVPWRTVKGQQLLAVGSKYSGRLICETPELYAVWPFKQAALGSEAAILAAARQAFHVRQVSLDGTSDDQSWETGGWQSAPIWAAVLGLPREAARLVSINFEDRLPNFTYKNINMVDPDPGHPRPRFPGFWETKMAYTPDNDHGGVSANALQCLLLQSDGRTIRLLPAWPEDWDVSFKLTATFNTTIECVYRNGKVQSLKVEPAERKTDIVDMSSFESRIRALVSVACADRNYLFGLPPMLDAQPVPGPTTASWLKSYGECLNGTLAGPWPNCLFKGKTVYAFGFDGVVPSPPAVPVNLVKRTLLADAKSGPVTVLKLEYDQPLDAMAQSAPSAGSLTLGKTAENGIVTFGQEVQVDRLEFTIDNPAHRRGQKTGFSFSVQSADGTWKVLLQGNVFGSIYSKRFEPVAARAVRLQIAAPVKQFDVFPVGK